MVDKFISADILVREQDERKSIHKKELDLNSCQTVGLITLTDSKRESEKNLNYNTLTVSYIIYSFKRYYEG